jgi:hypothetical protein
MEPVKTKARTVPEKSFKITTFEVVCQKLVSGYEVGKTYFIHISNIGNRLAVYKALAHFKEDSGYKVFDEIDHIWSHFKIINRSSREIKENN